MDATPDAMLSPTVPPAVRGVRRTIVVAEIIAACVLVLILAQTLTGALSLAAFSRLSTANTAERVELMAWDSAARINAGLTLGKPMAQFSGLDRLLEQGLSDVTDLKGAVVLLPDGYRLTERGQPGDIDPRLIQAALSHANALPTGMTRQSSGAVWTARDGVFELAVPLGGQAGAGVLALAVDTTAQVGMERDFLHHSLWVLALITGVAVLFLIVALGVVMPFDMLTRPGGRARLAVPLLALVLAQGAYAADTINAFRQAWLRSTQADVTMLTRSLQADVNRVLAMGIPIERLRGLDRIFTRLAERMPAIQSIALQDAAGIVRYAADKDGPLPAQAVQPTLEVNPSLSASPGSRPETAQASDLALARQEGISADGMRVVLPVQGGPAGQPAATGALLVQLDPSAIAAGVRARVLDAGTVTLVSAITASELFLLLTLLIARARRGLTVSVRVGVALRAEDAARAARPVMFGFLFAWALPLSFAPLFARTLPATFLDLPQQILLALPLSIEMLCGLFGVLLAGRLTDRRGWQRPVFIGLTLASLGALASANVDTLEALILTRGLVGMGYGMAWMGMQGFVVTRGTSAFRGRNMAWLIAGLFAGHLSGSSIGAMLAAQVGYRPVFVVSAIMLVLPLLGAWLLAERWRATHPETTEPIAALGAPSDVAGVTVPLSSASSATPVIPSPAAVPGAPGVGRRARLHNLRRLLLTRDFGALLVGSVIPFSMAQVGLLYFGLPLYMEMQGVPPSTTGRILMIYGLCMIYLGPSIARLVDPMRWKKQFILLGGILGSSGLIYLSVDSNVVFVALAVFMLALGSCWTSAAQTSWTLSLPSVQHYGPAGATSVMRAAEKFGQMIGPVVIGALFTVMGLGSGLAVAGAFYLTMAILFFFVSMRRTG